MSDPWLCRRLVGAEGDRFTPPTAGCDPFRQWFSGSKEGIVSIPWQSYKPEVRALVKQIELHFPGLTKTEVTLPDLDLISAVNQP